MTYFQYPNRFVPGTRVKAAEVNGLFDQLVASFGQVESDIDIAAANAAAAVSAANAAVTAAGSVTATASAAVSAASAAAAAAAAALPRQGGALQGPVTLNADATQPLQPVTLQQLTAALASLPGGGVTTFNARSGAITLRSADVTAALGFTPADSAALVNYAPLSGSPTFAAAIGRIGLLAQTAPADAKLWDWLVGNTGTLQLRAINDANSGATAALTITRDGAQVTAVNVGAPVNVTGGLSASGAFFGGVGADGTPGVGLRRVLVVAAGGAVSPDAAANDLTLILQ